MIETTVLNYLNSRLTEPVYMEIPSGEPKPYVVIQKTGSSNKDWIRRATFAIQSYHNSMAEAAKLNEKVKELMDNMPNIENSVTLAELDTDYNFTDTAKKGYRYQAVYNIFHY